MAPWRRKVQRIRQPSYTSSHDNIKFTQEVSPSEVNILDVTVLLHNNNIVTDLHVKSTDTHQYLLSSSCHPNHIKKSIPYSLAPRIRRICSTHHNFKQRTNELLEFLCQRGHKRDYVKTQINKAFHVPRKYTLYYQHKKSSNRTVCVTKAWSPYKVCCLSEWCFTISIGVSSDHSQPRCTGFVGCHERESDLHVYQSIKSNQVDISFNPQRTKVFFVTL